MLGPQLGGTIWEGLGGGVTLGHTLRFQKTIFDKLSTSCSAAPAPTPVYHHHGLGNLSQIEFVSWLSWSRCFGTAIETQTKTQAMFIKSAEGRVQSTWEKLMNHQNISDAPFVPKTFHIRGSHSTRTKKHCSSMKGFFLVTYHSVLTKHG